MLDELQIRGLGVIDEAVLPLGPGLTVVTGETGAGKTMVVTGLLLLFGGRADAARIRTGAEQSSVDGRIRLAKDSPMIQRVYDAGGAVDETIDGAELVLRRVVGARGRSRAYVGGATAPIAVLGELAEALVAVHGQSDQLRLARPAAQRAALDRYAGIDLDEFAAAYARWRRAAGDLAERTSRAAELRRESELLARGIAEIEAVAPQPGEDAELARLVARLGHADALSSAARGAHDGLLGDAEDAAPNATDVTQLLALISRSLGQRQAADPELDALAGRLTELLALAVDLGADFGAYADGLEADPGRLEKAESRRAELTNLIRRYCDEPDPSIAGVLRWAATAADRLTEIDVSDDAIAALRELCAVAAAETAGLAAELSARRRVAATALAAAVTDELRGLAMPDARLHVEAALRAVTGSTQTLVIAGQEAGVTPDGADNIQLLLQPHAGAPALPIGKGASGGELSRVMLALEVCLAATDRVPTLVFDEVDAGVGGRAAIEVGRRLARLARDRQVLVVTHLPQVAAFADQHVVVDKPFGNGDAGVTASDLRVVTDEARIVELARMLAGSGTATAREHAAELLADAAVHRAAT